MKLPKRPRSIFGHQRLPQQDESDEDDDEDRTSPSYIDKVCGFFFNIPDANVLVMSYLLCMWGYRPAGLRRLLA